MDTSNNKVVNKPSTDPVDKLIYEKGLRISQVIPVKKQDSLIIFLNNGVTIALKLSAFPRLKKATQIQLENWKLISKGVGVEWSELNEDLSLKGFIKQLIIQNTIKFLTGENTLAMAA